MNQLVVATRNRGKIRELEAMLDGLLSEIICAADLNGFPETVEDGVTFEENALKKAREAALFSGLPALADDSGLVVDALGGRPGVFSARFAGEGAGDAANNIRLLEEMSDVPADSRSAAFVCVLALVTPQGEEITFTGKVEGTILSTPRGGGGFGYDPLFLVKEFGLTMSELDIDRKNLVSHRGQAFRKFVEYLSLVSV